MTATVCLLHLFGIVLYVKLKRHCYKPAFTNKMSTVALPSEYSRFSLAKVALWIDEPWLQVAVMEKFPLRFR